MGAHSRHRDELVTQEVFIKHLLCALLNSGETENGPLDEVCSRQQECLCKGPGAALDLQYWKSEDTRPSGRSRVMGGGDKAGRLGGSLGLCLGGEGEESPEGREQRRGAPDSGGRMPGVLKDQGAFGQPRLLGEAPGNQGQGWLGPLLRKGLHQVETSGRYRGNGGLGGGRPC